MNKYKQSIKRLLVTAFSAAALCLSFSQIALAADYGCAAYGAGEYGEGGRCATGAAPDPDGGLVNTGERVLAFGVPAVMIIAGTVILFRARKQKRPAHDSSESDSSIPQ